jgi:hypothetical protein
LILLVTRYAPLKFIVLSVLYLSNLTPLFGVAIAYPVLWFLAVEEHFYFLWPLAVRRWANGILLGLVGFVIIFSPASRMISFYLARSNGFVSYMFNDYTWNALDGLACGGVLAILLRQFKPSRAVFQKALIVILGIALIVWGIGIPFGVVRQKPLGAALQVTRSVSLSWLRPTQAICTSEIVAVTRRGELRTLSVPSLGFCTLRSLCEKHWDFTCHRPLLHDPDSLFDSLRHRNTCIASIASIV